MRNLKKVIALVAVFAMLVSTVAFAATFDDVAETDTYSQAIETLNQLGILTGDDANNDGVMSFRPNDTITRAEITAIIARMQGRTGAVAQTETIFKDVPASHWASGYIQAATSTQIINGYGDGNFGPDDNVLYQDVVKMIMETLGYKNYALENGGYPVGYEIAAQRQKVLDGVIGGADGVEATRGMVAQMVDNAIEAPLMDRMAYGGNGQYVIYDGTWQPMRTCLSEYLGVTKLSGQVVSNGITALDGASGVVTTIRDETVNIRVKDLYKVQSNKYSVPNGTNLSDENYSIYPFYVGQTDASEYFGYNVTAYARMNANTDYDTLISIVPTEGQNTMATFNLSQFSYYDNDAGTTSSVRRPALYYMRNDNDRTPQRLPIDPNGVYVVYNGICGYSMDSVFAPQGNTATNYKVTADSKYSGQVTLIDNNNTSGYDFVFVDIAAGAAVQELSSRGVLSFKNDIGDRQIHENLVSRIEFESTSNNAYIKITKDGQPYDYTQLKEWDVLSIVANTNDTSHQYYDIEVLDGENTAITGTVDRVEQSNTSAGGSKGGEAYRINGTTYDAAEGYYAPSSIRAGSSGTFYVDKYGKIVAYNRDLNATSGTSSNYAYVLNGEITTGTFGETSPVLQFVYKDGSVNTASFAQSVTIYNPTAAFLNGVGSKNTDYITYKYKDDANAAAALESIIGKVVTLSASNGMIRSMTLPFNDVTTGVEKDSTLAELASGASFEYDQDTQELRVDSKRVDITPDTTVFFIGQPGDHFPYVGQDRKGMPIEDCSVTTGASLATMSSNEPAVAYSNGNVDGSADVVVLFNSNIATSPETGVAMVTSVGTGANGTLSVSYYQNGELIQAQTSENFSDTYNQLNENTLPGSLFKFGKTGDYITSATPYLTFDAVDGQIRGDVANGDVERGIPRVNMMYAGGKDEEINFGAVVGRNGNRIRIAPMTGEKVDGYYQMLPKPSDVITSVSLNNVQANYYVYDAARNSRSRIGLGGIGDIYVDRYLAGDDGVSTKDIINLGSYHGGNPVYGMLDYVYIRTYERTGDVVLYMQRQYDYTVGSAN